MLQHRGAPKASKPPSHVAEKSPSIARSRAPATPSTSPIQLVAAMRSPPQRDHSASHIGMVVTTVAIRPEPMPSFCAKPIRFMARKTMSPPTRAALRHCTAVGSAWPCHNATVSMTPPAHTKRMAFIKSGGIVCSAMPMAK